MLAVVTWFLTKALYFLSMLLATQLSEISNPCQSDVAMQGAALYTGEMMR